MKKSAIILLSLVLLAIIFSVAACNPKTGEPVEPAERDLSVNIGEWKVTVVTSGGEKEFTSADAKKLDSYVTLEATTKNKAGELSTSKYTGVYLSDVLSYAGVTDFSSLTIEASDGFSAEYDKDLALKPDTILAWEKDGKPLEGDQPIQMVPASGTGNQFVKMTARIIVND